MAGGRALGHSAVSGGCVARPVPPPSRHRSCSANSAHPPRQLCVTSAPEGERSWLYSPRGADVCWSDRVDALELTRHFGLGGRARLSDGPVARGKQGVVWRLETADEAWAV